MTKSLQKCALLSLLSLFFISASYSQAPTWVSNTAYGVTTNELSRASCTDPSGNVYLTGTYSGAFSFGAVSLPAIQGSSDVFIAKFNSAGVCQWANYIGSSSTDQIAGIVADANGVYVVGNYSNNCKFGPSITKTVVGSSDAYVARLDPSTGAFVWVNAFGCSAGETGYAICLDGSDGVYATGTFGGSAASTIASGVSSTFTITPTSGNTADVFVAKFSRSTGYCTWWSQTASSTVGELGRGICYNKKNIVVVGNYSGDATLGGITLPTPSGSDVFIARLDTTSGSWLSVQTAGTTMTNGTDVAVGCTYDSTTDATYVTGYFGNGSASSGLPTSITFGSTTLTTTGLGNIDDIFLLRYDHINNTFKWAKNYGGAGFERPLGLSLDGYGGIYVFGHDQSNSVSIGSFTLINGQASPVKQSPLMFKVTANDGTPLWALDGVVSASGAFANNVYGLVAVNSGATRTITANGHFSPSLQFGALASLSAAGGVSGDLFVSKLTDNNTCFTNISVEGNSLVISDEDIVAASADHTDFGTISTGGTVTRTFTIRNSGLATLTVSSIGISGSGAALFTVGGLILPTTVAAGTSKTFTVTYLPILAATHNATVTVNSDDCGKGTYNFSIKGIATSGSPLTATQSQVDLTCNNVCNGSASVVVSGGTAPYLYSWSPSGGILATASSLCAGAYSCTITDFTGTQIVKSFTITQPSAIASSVSINLAACLNVFNGSATVSVSGGTGPYTYSWLPSGGTASIASNLAAGAYNLTITDGNGCTKTQAVAIGINNPTQTGGVAGTAGGGMVSQTQPVIIASGVYTDNGCNFISTVTPYGASPVIGMVTSKVWIENTVPLVGGTPYAARHYEIMPAVNPSTSTGIVTLYFLQSEFDAFNSAPGSVLKLPTGPLDLTGIANLRVGKFLGASLDNSGLPGTYSGASNVINPADIGIVWNAVAARWEVSFDMAGFGGFLLQTSTFTLPVSWVSFTAAKLDEKVLLTWQTASETNNSHFIVEHSTDGRNFSAIGTVAAAGNSNSLHSYSFIHNTPANKTNFYRIMQVDNDGRKNYSDVRKINLDSKGTDFAILTNPVSNGKLQVQFNKPADAVVYNSAGQVVVKQFVAAGSQVINLSHLAAGVYMLKSGKESKRFIVE